MNLKEEIQASVMRLFGGHAKMQDCYRLDTLSREIDIEVDRLITIILGKLTE